MADPRLASIVRHIYKLAALQQTSEASDASLLWQYIRQRDESALQPWCAGMDTVKLSPTGRRAPFIADAFQIHARHVLARVAHGMIDSHFEWRRKRRMRRKSSLPIASW